MAMNIPVLDFAQVSSTPGKLATELLQACADWGFFYVHNHPIPQEEIDKIFELPAPPQEKSFFAQQDSAKSQIPYDPSRNAGFKPIHPTHKANKRPDPREAFSINKWVNSVAADSYLLPPILSSHRSQILAFQQSLHAFATQLLELIAISLDRPRSTFTCQHSRSQPNFDNFELMHYPPLTSLSPSSEPQPYRISPHTDWGTITLLFQQSIGGLQVRPPCYTSPQPSPSEKWTSAPVHNDMILINIGDMLEFWTGGLLKSTWHCVVPQIETRSLDRYCFAYFLHPDKEAMLEPIESLGKEGWAPRYEGKGRTAEQHIKARIEGAVQGNYALKSASGDEMVQENVATA